MPVFAVIETGGHQYEVKKGDVFLIDKVEKKKGSVIKFPKVLLLGDDKGTAKIGTPAVKTATVEAKVVEPEVKGEKLRIVKFKAKKRYKRTMGHRQKYTKVEITSIK